ncbi:hypothetical protein [Paraclostridium bifermentans]|uniref:hypothetical protein n=1 Tax=Paraclostridium bifermentans TaxID=1490 RepID=UPI001FF36F2E|nr:hypothetical protein [Paraclostridium bifermentans]UOW67234.1 hypothetical protein MTR78_11830 [Paraclostridium bifermentans]
MTNFNIKCKTKYSDLTKEYVKISKQLNEAKDTKITITFKVDNKNSNNFKNKIITSNNRNYNNLITID